MSDGLKKLVDVILNISQSIDKYKKDTVVQSLPTLTYVNRAKKFIEVNNYPGAEQMLLKALELPQQDPLVHKYLGLVYERTNRAELSVEHYQLSADLNPNDKNIWQRLGFALISTGKFEQAEKSFDNANKIQAGNSDTFTGWGMAFMKMKKYPEAREKFNIATKINKYNFTALFLCAVAEMKLKMYDLAENKLAFLSNTCPNESNSFEYARLKALKDDIENAVYYAQKALLYNPKMLPAYILLGQLYAQKLDEENSLKSFENAELQGLTTANLYLEWGKVLIKFENTVDAKQKLLKAYEMNSSDVDIIANLGLCCVARKENDEAQPLLQKAIEIEPENRTVKQALGIISFENGDIEKALQIFRSDDEDATNCYYMAKCYEKKGEDTKTREYYEASLRINNKYITAYKDYVNYLISKCEYEEAQRKLRKALKYYENDLKLLNLNFYVSYILVKENVCEYNVKEALAIANKIESLGADLFEYPAQKQELVGFLPERDAN